MIEEKVKEIRDFSYFHMFYSDILN